MENSKNLNPQNTTQKNVALSPRNKRLGSEVSKEYLTKECNWSRLYLTGKWLQVTNGEKLYKWYREQYYEEKNFPGLYIFGAYGSGKSTIAGLIATDIYSGFKSFPYFLSSHDLIKLVTIKDEVWRANIYNAMPLFIDDLGKEHASDIHASILNELIEHRYARLMPTIITSNLTIKDLCNRNLYASVADRLNDSKWMKKYESKGQSKRS